MRVPDSGMPEEAYWNRLFDIPLILEWLNIESIVDPIVEFGCGYGTFTIPIAKRTMQTLHAYDIDPSMVEVAVKNMKEANLDNVDFHLRDILEAGTGMEPESVGMVLMFNILHFDQRRIMLKESLRILKPDGIIAVIHWRKDITTPRGPNVQQRPDLQIILSALHGLDLHPVDSGRVLEPYHWGIQLVKGIGRSSFA
jgi:SAM-dependent methyltransferase